MSLTIDASTLLSYYQARSGVSAAGSSTSGSGASSSSASATAPTPPWSSKSAATPQSTLVTSVLAGSRFINPTAAQLPSNQANASDYKNLFALYQGISALQGLAQNASTTTLSTGDLAQYQSRFAAGLKEVNDFVASAPFSAFTVAQGTVASSAQTTVGVPHETDTYQTQPIFTGKLTDEVPALQGDVQFSLTLTKPSGVAKTVNFNLADLGSTPRTLPNVVNYLNSQLADAGVYTRFSNVRIPATPTTVKAGSSTITLPAGDDSFALKLVGVSTEAPTFSAPGSTPAVYVASTAGRTAAQATTANPADATLQLTKFDGGQTTATQADGTTKVDGLQFPSDVAAVRSTVTGPDGSVYVLADLNSAAPDGQAIKGTQDVALLKYDSTGQLQFSRTLGASSSASGYSLAVSADGKSVAVAGTVTGVLDGAQGVSSASTGGTDSFVSVYTSAGEEQWTTTRTGSVGTQPTGVSFGPDGSVYVVGKTGGSVLGGVAQGGQDGWLEAYSPKGASTFTTDIGTAQADHAAGVSADANGVVVASVENGHAVLRRFDFDASGKLQPGAVRDLGDLQGGDIAGLSRAADGSLIVAGSTHNGALDAGAVNAAYAGGRSAFVADVSADLTPSSGDTLSYLNLGADATTSALTVSGGQVYVTGQLDQGNGKTLGYAAAVDPSTGQIGWQDTLKGQDGLSAPASIAVAQNGASILDKLGLPSNPISYAGSQSLVANTSLRAGDQFFVRSGTGAAVPVTIQQGDTLTTLATKINRALGFTGKAEVVTVQGHDQLKITPVNSRTSITIQAGQGGRDALSSLGLTESLIRTDDTSATTTSTSTPKAYGLKLPTTLSIATQAQAKQTSVLLSSALTTLQLAYSDLAFPSTSTTSSTSSSSSGAVSAYITDRISNYQLALSRLTGSG
jgi:hypothetical protein